VVENKDGKVSNKLNMQQMLGTPIFMKRNLVDLFHNYGLTNPTKRAIVVGMDQKVQILC
jgi:hypothetical protein